MAVAVRSLVLLLERFQTDVLLAAETAVVLLVVLAQREVAFLLPLENRDAAGILGNPLLQGGHVQSHKSHPAVLRE